MAACWDADGDTDLYLGSGLMLDHGTDDSGVTGEIAPLLDETSLFLMQLDGSTSLEPFMQGMPRPPSPLLPPASTLTAMAFSEEEFIATLKREARDDEDDAEQLTRAADIKRRCRSKVDSHIRMLAEVVPGCLERITQKRPFRNQILDYAFEYVGRLQATANALSSRLHEIDARVDYALCKNRVVTVNALVLERIKDTITKRGISMDDLRQSKVLLHFFHGAKAFLLNQFTGKLYCFHGDSYRRIDVERRQPDTGYPRTLGNWPGNFSSNIDAACHLPNEHVLFFSGQNFIKYDVQADHALPGFPQRIDENSWPGLSFDRVDACLNWRNRILYFFRGDQYAAFDIARNCQAPGYPRAIKDGWRLVGELMPEGVDSAFSFGGKAYLMRGGIGIRYDMVGDFPDAPTEGQDMDAHLNPLVLD